MLYRNSQSNDSSSHVNGPISFVCITYHGLIILEIVVSQWRDAWCTLLLWIKINASIGKNIISQYAGIDVGAQFLSPHASYTFALVFSKFI